MTAVGLEADTSTAGVLNMGGATPNEAELYHVIGAYANHGYVGVQSSLHT